MEKFYTIDEVFKDFDEYQKFFSKALSLLKEGERKRVPSLQKVVPEILEVHFSSTIKAPRLRFPRWENTIIVELPGSGLATRMRGAARENALRKFVALVKVNEIACADEIAIRIKLMEK